MGDMLTAPSAHEIPPEQLDVIFYHGAYPLWTYLRRVLDIDITDICTRVAKTEPVLTPRNGPAIVARTVSPAEATPALESVYNNDVIFLLNSINVVFRTLQLGAERNDEKILMNYKFDLDIATNRISLVHADSNEPVSDLRIAVMIKP